VGRQTEAGDLQEEKVTEFLREEGMGGRLLVEKKGVRKL
jgi:hypothetical protein